MPANGRLPNILKLTKAPGGVKTMVGEALHIVQRMIEAMENPLEKQ